jgi:hypothetical protein
MGLFSSTKVKNVPLYTPEQQEQIKQLIQQGGQPAMDLLMSIIGGPPEDVFQKSYVDPAMQSYKQDVLPAIGERFGSGDTGASSALNQTLARSAVDLETMLGKQYGDFINQYTGQQLNAANQYYGLSQQKMNEPYLYQKKGWLDETLDVAEKGVKLYGKYMAGGI